MAQPAPTRGIPGLVRHLRDGNKVQQLVVTDTLAKMLRDSDPEELDAAAEAAAAAGAIAPLVAIVSGGQSGSLLLAVDTLIMLAYESPQRADSTAAAGGVAELAQLLRSEVRAQEAAIRALSTITAS